MDAMDKMWLSLYAIGFMVLASVLITFARAKTKGFIRLILSTVAVFILICSFFLGLISIV
ncbi:DUF2768 family protein [Chengkuizengella axinellae]|uniref:DUF2768 family protein n=1 Tax=Chengkuizengella axinellae TaxID=3064388 RepID=A0ABT9IWQ1_9BACL|nr:DUF2768 family protein [Chengkuizengella sp. 2205SS18-9]MDP5273786.1 DUF2768 family protein [Chengkuizengella sp. 2205SS18-9]